MTAKVNLCGHRDPNLAARKCLACKRIAQAIHRGKDPDEAKAHGLKEPTCRSCRVRFYVTTPKLRDGYEPMVLEPKQVRWLENAARLFDAESDGDTWSAEDFVAWLRPDLTGRVRIEDMAGSAVWQGGGRKGSGPGTTRISSPDPIPYFPRPNGWKKSA